MNVKELALKDALRHAINYHGIDADLGTPDHVLADALVGEVYKHLNGTTDVQIYEGMTPEERAAL